MLIDRELLTKVARTSADFISKSKVNSQLRHIFFSTNIASSTNGSTGILMNLPFPFASAWSIDGEKFQKVLDSTAQEEVNLDTSVKGLVKISADSYTIKANCINPKGIPLFTVPPTKVPLPANVWTSIKEVYPFVCKDNIHHELRVVLVSDDGYTYATDNLRAVRSKHGVKNWKSLEIPDVLLSKIIGYQEVPSHYAVTPGQVWFFYEDKSVYTGLLDDKFPNIKALFDQQDKRKEQVRIKYNGGEVVTALQRILIFTKEYKEIASVELVNSFMKIAYHQESTDDDIVEQIEYEIVDGELPGETFGINVPKLIQCFESAESMVLYIDDRIRFTGGNRDIICQTNTLR